MRIRLIDILVIVLFISIVSCNEKEEPKPEPIKIEDKVYPAVLVDKTDFKIEVSKSCVVNITKGGGEYTILATDPEVLDVKLENNKIKINALKIGISDVLVSDKNCQFARFKVTSYVKNVSFDRDDFNFEIKVGNSSKFVFNITNGNGGYKIVSESDIMDVKIIENQITLKAIKGGNATFKIIDQFGFETIVPVTIKALIIAYTEDEKAKFMASNSEVFIYKGRNYGGKSYYSQYSKTEDEYKIYGVGNSYFQYFIKFKGNMDVGVKTDATIQKGNAFRPESREVNLEIIKNDGTYFWAIYYYTYTYKGRMKLRAGKVCLKLNP